MQNRNLILGILLIIISTGIIYLVVSPKPAETPSSGQNSVEKNGFPQQPDDAVVKVLEFHKADYDKAAAEGKIVFLYFYANWCPICREEVPIMYKTLNEQTDLRLIGFRVNFNDSETDDDERELARQFGVAYQHTKVVLKNGERILKSPEVWDHDRYHAELENILK